MTNEEWVVYTVRDGDEWVVSCETQGEWDRWLRAHNFETPPDYLMLVATGLTEQQAKLMEGLADADE